MSETIGELFKRRFLHKTSDFALQEKSGRVGWYYHRQGRAVTMDDITRHIDGVNTLAAYPVKEDQTSTFLVLDIDQKKGMDATLEQAQEATRKTCRIVSSLFDIEEGVPYLVEDSGNRGYHVWLFFAEPIISEKIKGLGDFIADQVEPPKEIGIEVYPKQGTVFEGVGNCVKLPLGVHQKSGRRNLFVNNRFQELNDELQWRALSNVPLLTMGQVNRVLEKNRIKVFKPVEANSFSTGLPCITNLMEEGPNQGSRAFALFYLAVNLIHMGIPIRHIETLLDDVNGIGAAPLLPNEVEKALNSAKRKNYSRFPCRNPAMDTYCTRSCKFFTSKRSQRNEKVISRD